MNFVKSSSIGVHISKTQVIFSFLLSILLLICFVGCSDQVRLSSAEELAEFERAGPVLPTIDVDLLIRSKIGGAPLPGEVLEITMPAILQVVTAEEPDAAEAVGPYVCRVSENGTITLPVVGEIEVAGKIEAEIESAIIDAYYPEYATTRPSVFVNLVERLEQPLFTIIGLVGTPGNIPYPPDARYNVMQAIGAAGGLGGGEPRYASVYRLKPDGTIINATFKIANFGDSSGLTDTLSTLVKPGDIIEVAHTPRTRTNAFLDELFYFNIGAYWPIGSRR